MREAVPEAQPSQFKRKARPFPPSSLPLQPRPLGGSVNLPPSRLPRRPRRGVEAEPRLSARPGRARPASRLAAQVLPGARAGRAAGGLSVPAPGPGVRRRISPEPREESGERAPARCFPSYRQKHLGRLSRVESPGKRFFSRGCVRKAFPWGLGDRGEPTGICRKGVSRQPHPAPSLRALLPQSSLRNSLRIRYLGHARKKKYTFYLQESFPDF